MLNKKIDFFFGCSLTQAALIWFLEWICFHMKAGMATRYQEAPDCSWSCIAPISFAKGITNNAEKQIFSSQPLENKNTEGILAT